MCANAFYNQACALSREGEQEAALAALERSITSGWDDLDWLDSDADLIEVRKMPEFTAQREVWGQTIAEKLKAEVDAALAGFKSYRFNFKLPNLDAKPVKLTDFRGKVVIVDLWGTWCPPCRSEIPSFVKLQEKYGELGLQVVGLNYERTEPADAVKRIREFQTANAMNYRCLVGDAKTMTLIPSFSGYPTTLFLDRTGKVRLQFDGAYSYSRLEAVVLALLNETKS